MTRGNVDLKVVLGRLGTVAGRKLLLIAGYRNRLTHFYSDVTREELYGTVRDGLGDLEQIAAELRAAAARLSAR